VSDDPNSVKDIADMASAHSGWFAAFLVGTWGIVLRALVGRHIRREEKQRDLDEKTLNRLALIEQRLAVIEARSHDRRREDRNQYEDQT
jgi:hypothetical protein